MFSFHHVSLSVENMKESVLFYKKIGFTKILEWKSEDQNIIITHMKLNDIFLELFWFKDRCPPPDSAKSLETDLQRVD